ncbi:BON domain-containing protein [Marinicauda algicola]|uniref:BON domain-containing protein n=1 Tax=Marinicauda algicola TaxID=2029849 RepID=A0A4V3RY35_9PROT|nr:BON domain-containing protein [Marinicauda algicola]TGY88879.1 BON domain-containing protein [Marinicauda algicola]
MVRLALLALCALSVSACTSLQPGRSLGRGIDDFNASMQIKSAMLRSEGYALEGVDVEVTEGIALLSGTAPRLEDKLHAECLTWSAPAVRSVVNEIEIARARGPADTARDAVVTQQVRGRLLADREVRSVNFNIETRDGVVYLLGFARSAGERERATRHASLVEGVERVVVLVRVPGEDAVLEPRGERRAELCDVPAAG